MLAGIDILAAGDDGIVNVVILVVVVLLWAVGGLVQRAKQKQAEREARERGDRKSSQASPDETQPAQRPQASRPQGPPKARSVQEIVQAMRQAARQRLRGPKDQPQAATPPPAPPAREPEPKSQPLQQRHLAPSAQGQQVRLETERLAQRLQREGADRTRRIGGGQLGRLSEQPEAAPVAAVDQERNVVHLNAAEARRAIIYSEILGPPLALRRGQASWEL